MTEPAERLMSVDAATQWRRTMRGRVVLTNGVFDLLHPGHVDLLLAARRLGDVLIVAINSDASVRRLKGPQRPVRTAEERGYVLAALSMVDAVVVFEEDTPARLIERLTPDILVKGGDYSEASVVGAAETRARGGEVHIIPLTPGHSTTSTLARFRDPDAAPSTDA